MLSQISTSLSHTSSALAGTATAALSSRRPPSGRNFFRFYVFPAFNSRRRRFSRIVSMDGSSSPSAKASIGSIAEDLKNKRLGDTDGVNNVLKDGNFCQSRVKLKLEELNWDHSFVRELPGDTRTDLLPRQVWFLCRVFYTFLVFL